MSISVQARAGRYQLRVTHKLLPRPFFFTFDDEPSARDYGAQLRTLLNNGVVPADLVKVDKTPPVGELLFTVITSYSVVAPHVTQSDAALLDAMMDELAGLRVSDLDHAWVDTYVRSLKVKRNHSPGTIRKRVGVLARVLDWHFKRVGGGVNALRSLPVGYSQYNDGDLAEGAEVREDVSRDRRLLEGEEDKIRAKAGDLALLFDVIVNAGLRLREAYRLRVDQVDLKAGVLRVEGSKVHRGRKKQRVVPLTPDLRAKLKDHCKGRVGLLWPFWDGTTEGLRKTTMDLSRGFARVFKQAGVVGLTEHDLRHEACCRWFEMRRPDGAWLFSEMEICRIMGWSSPKMALRYASLRGEDLAARMQIG